MPNKKNHNLIPQDLILSRMKDLFLLKSLIIIGISIGILAAYIYGGQAITNKLSKTAAEITEKSAYTQSVKLQEQITGLETEIAGIQSTITRIQFQLTDNEVQGEVIDTNICDLINYVYENKPNNITLIMLEDNYVTQTYGDAVASSGETVESNPPNDAEGDAETVAGDAETAEESIAPTEIVRKDVITYSDDSEKILTIRGFAVDESKLSEFIGILNEYEYIQDCRISAIEAVEVDDYIINLFSIEIYM